MTGDLAPLPLSHTLLINQIDGDDISMGTANPMTSLLRLLKNINPHM